MRSRPRGFRIMLPLVTPVLAIPVLSVSWFLQRFIVEGLTSGSVKG
ncbi:MAG: hypothetical protein M0026_20275 [Nocardiopsaceae bacterium]|nr:hypothetical protein [Nocardiopsaceae bacterium]